MRVFRNKNGDMTGLCGRSVPILSICWSGSDRSNGIRVGTFSELLHFIPHSVRSCAMICSAGRHPMGTIANIRSFSPHFVRSCAMICSADRHPMGMIANIRSFSPHSVRSSAMICSEDRHPMGMIANDQSFSPHCTRKAAIGIAGRSRYIRTGRDAARPKAPSLPSHDRRTSALHEGSRPDPS